MVTIFTLRYFIGVFDFSFIQSEGYIGDIGTYIKFCQQVFVLIPSTKLHRHLLIFSDVASHMRVFFFVGWDLRHQVLRPLLAYCTAPDDR
jgi:hypothetical protein